ncbi:hypothetical protein AKG11_24630 [Shinella sp. SUS2]|nr:hypothetical protein AKG11_24630 [Shinella sp. SUS2]KOC73183.1 hypothetical protein AKG10_23800 [Shinella sp. GWS1]
MQEATAALQRAGAPFEQKTGFHIKVHAFNFWPATGTIMVDGDLKRRQEQGLPAFIRLLRDAGLISNKPTQSVDTPQDFIIDRCDHEGEFATC